MPGRIGDRDGLRSVSTRRLRSLIEPRCLSPRTFNEFRDQDATGARRSSYRKLPPQLLIKLSIVKLDGSLFDVHVRRNSTVAELKEAIEEVFSTSPREDQGNISWSHVWGHFCLCYQDQKLLTDKACIRNFGIKDGDQIHFIRHMGINHSPMKRRSKSQNARCKAYSQLESELNAPQDERQIAHNDNDTKEDYEDSSRNHSSEGQDELALPDFKLAHFLKGCLSYSRFWVIARRAAGGQTRPARLSLQLFGTRNRMLQL